MNTFVSKSSVGGIVNKSRQGVLGETDKFLNSFSNKKKVEASFSMNSIHFPELGSCSVKNGIETESKNYMGAIQTQNNEVLCIVNKVPEGCICYTLEKNNKITKRVGDARLSYFHDRQTVYDMNGVIDIMSSKWEKYRENYINLYGEDVYEKMYTMPITNDNVLGDGELDEDKYSEYSDTEEYNDMEYYY